MLEFAPKMPDSADNRRDDQSTALVPLKEERGISFVQFALQPPYDARLVFWERRDSVTAASFRLLRQRLIDRGDPKIVLCTSATRGEGKTTLAANLALALAELTKFRVLLLETSLRGAAIGEMFGFKPPQGFARQLALHKANPGAPWVVVQISGLPLYILAAEPRCCPKCAAVLTEEASFCGMCGNQAVEEAQVPIDAVAFASAMKRFRESFQYVIVDAPPVLLSGDVNLIQDATEAIVFATRKGRSESRDLRRAIEQVAPAQVAAVALIED
jgi:Mrp family chromosome partitioning ATPase